MGRNTDNKKAMAIAMATINGTQMMPGLAMPLTQIAKDGMEHASKLNIVDGGTLLDELFFKTAYASTFTTPVTGNVSGETVENGTQSVENGGIATSMTVQNSGYQNVSSGGTAANTKVNVNGTQNVSTGGIATGTTVVGVSYGNTGVQNVYSGGTATGTKVNGWGYQNVSSGGTAADTTLTWGTQNVYSGGTTTGTRASGGGYQLVYGGIATGTTVDKNGFQYVYDGGTATGTTVNENGTQNVESGGTATGTTVNENGTLNVLTGGTVSDTKLQSGGTQNIYNGSTVTGTTFDGGGAQTIQNGATMSGQIVNNSGTQKIVLGGTAASATLNNGTQDVYGTVSDTKLQSGGTQNIYNGSIVTGTTFDGGGTQAIQDGATMSGQIVNNSGTQKIVLGGTAAGTIIEDNGTQIVVKDGKAENTTIKKQGTQIIEQGADIKKVKLEQGSIQLGRESTLVQQPGTYAIKGNLETVNGGTVKFAQGVAGQTLTIENMKGNASFQIYTDIKEGKSDHITIQYVTADQNNEKGNHKIKIESDPFIRDNKEFGASVNAKDGKVEFADVPEGTKFEAETTEFNAYRYKPNLVETTADGRTKYGIGSIVEGDLNAGELVYAGMETAAGSIMTLRQENAAITKRIGELRQQGDKGGIWAQAYGGKQQADSVERRQIKQSGSGIAVGYDNKTSETETGTWYVGYTVGYLKNDLTMESSEGKNKSLSFGVYGAWQGKNGEFGNLVLKQSRLSNDLTSHLMNNKTDSADYSNWGTTLGAEYGYRKQLQGNAYIEPTVSFTYGKIGSANYTTKAGTIANTEAMNTFVGKLGLTYGQQMGQANGYVRIAAAREFSASAKTSMHTGTLKAVEEEQDFKQNWLEFALGISGKTGDNSSGYLELMRTNGGKTHTPWQISAGLRWSV